MQAIVEAQAALIEELRSRVEELEARLGKDSSNSSLPPSRDHTDRRARRAAEAKARRAANKAARPPGKQKGDPGATLMRRVAEEVVIHAPEVCVGCGASLAAARVVATATRQVLDIPEPHLEATDHVVVAKRCACGCETRAAFPPEATGPVVWGPRAKATGSYLLARQHLPLRRAAEAMADPFAAPMGEGTLAGLMLEAAGALPAFMGRIIEALHASPVVHADETSVRVGVGLGWVHTVSSRYYTHLAVEDRRGIDAIVAIGVLGGYAGTIVHDGFASYDCEELSGATHAQCNQHLIRTLGDLASHHSQTPWANAMKSLLHQARELSEQAAAAGLTAVPADIAGAMRTRYGEILAQALAWLPLTPRRGASTAVAGPTRSERPGTLLPGCVGTKTRCCACWKTLGYRPTNEAERSFRMCKIHDKVSGHFRSWANAEAFCTLRSYLQTGAKHRRSAMELLVRLWTPAGARLPSVAGPDTG